jgi:hypothetical protein
LHCSGRAAIDAGIPERAAAVSSNDADEIDAGGKPADIRACCCLAQKVA